MREKIVKKLIKWLYKYHFSTKRINFCVIIIKDLLQVTTPTINAIFATDSNGFGG